MSKKKIAILLVSLPSFLFFLINLPSIFEYINQNAGRILGWFSGISTSITVFVVAKEKFFDTGRIKKLFRQYGKERILQSLEILCSELDYYEMEELIERIYAMNHTIATKMRAAVRELSFILRENAPPPPDPSSEIALKKTLSKKEEFELLREVGTLLNIIDKKIDINRERGKLVRRDAYQRRIKHAANVPIRHFKKFVKEPENFPRYKENEKRKKLHKNLMKSEED